MATKRIIELDAGALASGDYIITDSATAGTKKVDLTTTLGDYATQAAVDAALALKADESAMETALAAKADAADLTELEGVVDGKVGIDAYSPLLTAGAAEGVTGGGPTDTAAWVERTCPGTDGPASIGSIHGRTVVWNQLCDLASVGQNKATVTRSGNVLTVAADGTAAYFGVCLTKSGEQFPANHKALLRAKVDGSAGITGFSDFRTNLTPATSGSRTLASDGTLLCICAPTSAGAVYLNASLSGTSTSGQTFTVTEPMLLDLTAMFGAGNEPSTVAEFEQLFPDAYYPYDAGSLLSVHMDGIETVGFNLWDEQWEVGNISDSSGQNVSGTDTWRSTNYIPVFPNTTYYIAATAVSGSQGYVRARFYDSDKGYIGSTDANGQSLRANRTFTTPANAYFMRFVPQLTNITDKQVCISLSDPSRNGTYEPHWSQTRPVPASTYFPNGMRSAGSVYDELTSGAAVTRVGSVDLGTLTWSKVGSYYATSAALTNVLTPATGGVVANAACDTYEVMASNSVSGGAAGGIGIRPNGALYASDNGASPTGTLYYALATPTTTTIDPPLNLTYKAAAGGTERIAHTDPTAAPTLAITYGSTPAGIVASALAAIADPDGPTATATHAVGTYLTMGGKLYRVTTAIAIGETITPGTNVVATTVMAEVLSLVQ